MNISDHFPVDLDCLRYKWHILILANRPDLRFVPVASLVACESRYDPERLKELSKYFDNPPIVVATRPDGRHTIVDGHHRAILHKLGNKTEILALVYPTPTA